MAMPPAMKWRLYFNKRESAPMVCSLDNGHVSSEFAVQRAILRDVRFIATSTPEQARSDRGIQHGSLYGPIDIPFCGEQPVFWIEFEAALKMEHGTAYFDGVESNMP